MINQELYHKNSTKESLEVGVISKLEDLKYKLQNAKNTIYSYLENSQNNIANIRTYRDEITSLLAITILRERNNGKEAPSNLEQVYKNQCFKVYSTNFAIVEDILRNPTLAFVNYYSSPMTCYCASVSKILKYDNDKLPAEEIAKSLDIIPLSLMFKAKLKNEVSLYNTPNSKIIKQKTLRYLQNFNFYNNEILFVKDNKSYTRQEVIRTIRNKRASHTEYGFEFKDLQEEMMFTMTIFQIAWEVVYNFLNIDCFD